MDSSVAKWCEQVPFVNISISNDNIKSSVNQLVSIIRPQWNNENVNIQDISEGYTNRLLAVYLGGNLSTADVFLVRVNGNGTDLFVDRPLELCHLLILNEFNSAAKVHLRFQNGICYDFLHGRVFDFDMISSFDHIKLVAREFARIHSIPMSKYQSWLPFCKEGFLFTTVNRLIPQLPQVLKDPLQNKKYQDEFPSAEVLHREVDLLQHRLLQHPPSLALCHNDALYNNLILSKDEKRVYLIDFEFGAVNYTAFDIGNHFMEFAGMENIDFNKFPSQKFQYLWLRYYLAYRAMFEQHFCHSTAEQRPDENEEEEEPDFNSIPDVEVERLFVQVNQFSLVSHILWGLVAIFQSQNSFVPYDFLNFALIRWKEYLLSRDRVLGLKYPVNP